MRPTGADRHALRQKPDVEAAEENGQPQVRVIGRTGIVF
jgi:hypothetical protein